MKMLALYNALAIICEVVGVIGMIIGVPLSKIAKDYSYSYPLGCLLCAIVGVLVHLALHSGLLNFLA